MNRTWAKVLVVLAVVAMAGVYIAWPRYLPDPDERNRVRSPGGMSMVMPPEWEAVPQAGDSTFSDGLMLRPKADGKRQPSILLRRMIDPPSPNSLMASDDTKVKTVTFQGSPGYLVEKTLKIEHLYRIVFKPKGDWYQLTLSCPLPIEYEGSDWQKYMETFRAADGSSTTRPATAPVALPD